MQLWTAIVVEALITVISLEVPKDTQDVVIFSKLCLGICGVNIQPHVVHLLTPKIIK